MDPDPRVIIGRCRRQGSLALRLEDAQINAAGPAVAPAQIPGRHDERAVVCQHLTQVMQFPAQIGQRLRVRRVRPEHPGNALPGLGHAGMGHQERDEGHRTRRMRSNTSPVVGDRLLTQEGYLQHSDAAP